MALIDARASEMLEAEGVPGAVVEAMVACGTSPRMGEAFATLAASVGFHGLSYILVGCPAAQPRLIEHWTTTGDGWTACYAARGYHLVDPRIVLTRNRAVPVAWEARSQAGEPRTRDFVREAGRHRICGGVAWSLHDARIGRAVVAWDSGRSHAAALPLRLGTLALLAGFVHEALAVHCNATMAAQDEGPLTHRERECVALVARGMTSADVGMKLGITTRTANFHIGNVMTKLRAVSRSEAIARAVAANLVSFDG